VLFNKLAFANVTRFCTNSYIPRIGDERLVNFLSRLKMMRRTISDISKDVMYEGRKPDPNDIFLTLPRTVGYFISATPGAMARSKALCVSFETFKNRDLACALLNSNVFFWYWRSYGDGFLLGVDVLRGLPVPNTIDDNDECVGFVRRLEEVLPECTTFKKYRGEQIPNYNFNRRMDILLDIDDWIVKHVAPDLKLPRDIFAQYKSNSFLRPLDLSAITGAAAEVEDKE